MTIEFEAYEFVNAAEALQHVNASGRGVAIAWNNECLVVEKADANRLAEAGVQFAYLFDHEMPDGRWRITSVPVND